MQKNTREDGFTLIEVLVVIGVIAILAAIAVPLFLNQRKNAAQAAVESDLKNAALVMQDEMVANKGKFLAYIPNYDNRSNQVDVSLNKFMSSQNKFCLIGRSLTYPDIVLSYDSKNGGLVPKGQPCTAPTGATATETSFATVLDDKKALIIHSSNGTLEQTRAYLHSYGFGTIDYIDNPDPSTYANYDVIVAMGRVWALPRAVSINLEAGYQNGAKIITDGNDSTAGHLPTIIKTSALRSTGVANFNQTGQTGLNPVFPYTFTQASIGNDNWSCILTATDGAVIVATTPDPLNSSNKCLTAVGISSGKGQWIHLNHMPFTGTLGMSEAALNWLVY